MSEPISACHPDGIRRGHDRASARCIFQIAVTAFHYETNRHDGPLSRPPLTAFQSGLGFALQVMTAAALEPRRSFPNEGGESMMPAATIDRVRRTKPRTTAALHELLQSIEREYREMPGLSVTAPQAERLWGLRSTTCEFVLTTL